MRPNDFVTRIGMPGGASRELDCWRSLDQRNNAGELAHWTHQRFELDLGIDEPSRRDMLKYMAASLAFAGLGGCRRPPPEKIVPAVRGDSASTVESLYFATATVRDGYGMGVLARSVSGRPVKIEGNPLHPASLGATDIFAQASILTLYDPDRSKTVYEGNHISTWDAVHARLAQRLQHAARQHGRGMRLLTGPVSSPTMLRLIGQWSRLFPEAKWHVHSPIPFLNGGKGSREYFGRQVEIVYDFRRADVIVSLDDDFLHGLPGSVRNARDFSDRRRFRTGQDAVPNRLFVAGPCPTVTGSNADHRLPVKGSRIVAIADALLATVSAGDSQPPPTAAVHSEEENNWIHAAANQLRQAAGRSVVIAGYRQPPAVHGVAAWLNELLGNGGQTVKYIEPVAGQANSFEELAQDIERGHVHDLLILDANPVYSAPADVPFAELLGNVEFVLHAGMYRDETGLAAHWHVPLAHVLESWGDVRAYDGTATIIQPLIKPLYHGQSGIQIMAALSGEDWGDDLKLVQNTWREHSVGEFHEWWRQSLEPGIIADSHAHPVAVETNRQEVRRMLDQKLAAQVPDSSIEIGFLPDPHVWDGTFANNGWLQELPKPITTITWENALLLGPSMAERLGVQPGQMVKVDHGGKLLAWPVWIVPGHADQTVTAYLGYGRRAAGQVGNGKGFSAYALMRQTSGWSDDGLKLNPTQEIHSIPSTQHHHLMEPRDLVRRLDWQTVAAGAFGTESHATHQPSFFPSGSEPPPRPQWGMSIDLTACIGCNACTIACQAENNIPVVGPREVRRGREMHWIRVDRYFSGSPHNPSMYHMPVPCMHCETAPCELVCPVNATTHSADGLNEMTYNRCVGTRYCSNNCPYKVRRFNFFQYSDRQTESYKLMRNPDVTVRDRGVMEKCTYCVQRIRQAEIVARKANRLIADGEVQTACQQVCPTRAIMFGDTLDPQSQVAALKKQPHDYSLLGDLNTRPRTTYLAAIRHQHIPADPAREPLQEGISHE